MSYKISKEELIKELKEIINKWCKDYNYTYEEGVKILKDMFKERKRMKDKIDEYEECEKQWY
jgi:polyhydroxyalkanoate synthesis regulator phasin